MARSFSLNWVIFLVSISYSFNLAVALALGFVRYLFSPDSRVDPLFNVVGQLGCVSDSFPSKLLFSVQSCSLVFCEETTPFPPSALLLWCLMLSPVRPLLGFSVIAQPIQLSFLVIAQYFSHGHHDLLMLFFGLGDAGNSHAAGCSRILPSSH
ncbi:hypothetical protein AMECASPLE_032752 [Ameca splendens]|uniref:Uncharacterized protein n=1 Tax=Ameca splendens TaxID=208324 RepID=A0ABV0XVN2_9TELE